MEEKKSDRPTFKEPSQPEGIEQEKIKLKVKGESGQSRVANRVAPPADNESQSPAQINPAVSGKSDTNTESEKSIRSKEDLLSIVADPHASEHEWLAACNELGKHQHPTVKSKKWMIAGLSLVFIALLGVAGYGAMNWMHVTPQAVPETSHLSDIDLQPYMLVMQKKIKQYWKPPKNYGRVVAHFKLHKNGEISNLGFDQMMGYSPSDMAALKSIEDASTFPPLPPGAPESVDVSFTFDYRNVPHAAKPD